MTAISSCIDSVAIRKAVESDNYEIVKAAGNKPRHLQLEALDLLCAEEISIEEIDTNRFLASYTCDDPNYLFDVRFMWDDDTGKLLLHGIDKQEISAAHLCYTLHHVRRNRRQRPG